MSFIVAKIQTIFESYKYPMIFLRHKGHKGVWHLCVALSGSYSLLNLDIVFESANKLPENLEFSDILLIFALEILLIYGYNRIKSDPDAFVEAVCIQQQ